MTDQSEFCAQYRIDKKAFDSANISWSELMQIRADYNNKRDELAAVGAYFVERLRRLETVHSLRMRLKDPDHLVEKIIRKRREDISLDIKPSNYQDYIKDLIGIRALHLFKEDWLRIHQFIKDNWNPQPNPVANIRNGDPQKVIDKFTEHGCDIKEHRFGYRSVHYIVQSQLDANSCPLEIQVRTIFEEGWSEIDHQVRYPYDVDNSLLNEYNTIFNRLAGAADEMGTFVKTLKEEVFRLGQDNKKLSHEKEELTQKLKDYIGKLDIAEGEKVALRADLERLSSLNLACLEPTSIRALSPDFISDLLRPEDLFPRGS